MEYIMQTKILSVLVAIATSVCVFSACSEDSDAGSTPVNNSGKTPAENATYAKLDSCSFVASEGSCSIDALMKTDFLGDTIHFVMNENGSAVLKERLESICPETGEVSNISLDKREDTLRVSIEYEEFPPDTIVKYNESLGKNDTLIMEKPRRKCMCYANYEIDIPAEFVGAKYLTFNGTTFFDIAYEP